MNRITMLYQLDLLLKNCKGCSHSQENGSPDIRCQGCSFYPQIRWIGNQLGRKKQMAVLTLEEYQDCKAQGMTDTQIAVKVNTSPSYLYQLKKKWQISPKQADTGEIKQKECTCKGKENNAKYEREISNLKDYINKQKEELLSLRDENSGLAEERVNNDRIIQNQKYQLGQYAKEMELLQEEVQALKYFARRYLEA